MRRVSSFSLLFALALAACSSGSRVNVEVVTGLVPGPEFGYVVTEIYPPGDDSEGLVRVLHAEAVSRFHDEYLRGHRVATFDGIAMGEQRIRVSLLRPDRTLLVTQEISITVNAPNMLARIRIDRDCVAVECPTAASPGATACYGGMCADPRCNPTDPTTFEFCGAIRFCHADTDCPMPAACSTRHCVEGNCTADPYAPSDATSACDETEWCDPTSGCDELPGAVASGDAGAADAGLMGDGSIDTDAGVDAAMPDADVCYQTICDNPAFPCWYSYVDCLSPTRDCVPFVRREAGSSCGGTSLCSSSAVCLACPAAPLCDPMSDGDGDGIPDRMDFETCDGTDEDGDGTVDEGLPLGPTTYADTDGDMHGDPATGGRRCIGLPGFVVAMDDCDDTSASVSPDAPEICDRIDDDCDGLVDDMDPSIAMPFGGGDGSASAPFLICTRAHFDAVGVLGPMSAHYRQMRDLDLAGTPIRPIGMAGIDPDVAGGGFTGDYDGGTNTLLNVAFAEAGPGPSGLFRRIDPGGRVHDLTLARVAMDGTDVVGGVAGTSFGDVVNVRVAIGTITSHATAGGLVGHLRAPGTIAGSSVDALTISSAADSPRVGTVVDTGVGGAVGVMYGGSATDTVLTNVVVSWSATGTSIPSWTFAGGFVGYVNGATITRAHVTGRIDAVLNVGGFVGACEGPGMLVDDVADVDTTARTNAGGFAAVDKCATTRCGARGDVTSTLGSAGGFADLIQCNVGVPMSELFASGNVSAQRTVGGFAAVVQARTASGGTIDEIVTYGSLTGGSGATMGGLAAIFTGCTVTDAVAMNESITGGARMGAWIGSDPTTLGTTESYRRAVIPLPDEGGGLDYVDVLALSDAQMMDTSQLPMIDFTAIWAEAMSRTDGRLLGPVLRLECGTDGITCF